MSSSPSPQAADALTNEGLVLEDAGQLDAAEARHRQALAVCPDHYPALLNLAMLLTRRRRFAEAEATYQRAIRGLPDEPAAWCNLGALLTCLRREDDALACLNQALHLRPGYDKARFNLGYLWLRQGRWAEGLLCNESRPFSATLQAKLGLTRWAGEPLAGRTLLLATDGGHGDLIHMARYVPMLKAMGAGRVAVWGHKALGACLSTLPTLDRFIAFDEPFALAEWDTWAPLMSLPFLCGTTRDSVPAALPYLRADAARARQRAAQGMAPGPGPALRVGLVWRGNPLHENDDQRSLPSVATLAPLWQVPGVRFFSLQCGAGSDEAAHPPPGQSFERLAEPLGDFADTAAVVANLDLVIGVDTSVVHLAGAMACPVWVLLSDYKTDWRWLNEVEDTPWYPGVMRLFRQDASADWTPVVARVAQALAERAASVGSGRTDES